MQLGTESQETEGEGRYMRKSQNWEERYMHRLSVIYVAQTVGKTKFTNHLPSIIEDQILPFIAISFLRLNDSLLLDF